MFKTENKNLKKRKNKSLKKKKINLQKSFTQIYAEIKQKKIKRKITRTKKQNPL